MVVDHTVEVVVANATIALAAPAGRTVARQTETAQLLHVHVQQRPGSRPLVAAVTLPLTAQPAREPVPAQHTFQIVERERRTIPANLAGPRFVSRRARPRASSPVPDPPPRRSLARVGAREQRADDAHFADAGADRCRQRDGRRGDEDPRDAGEASPAGEDPHGRRGDRDEPLDGYGSAGARSTGTSTRTPPGGCARRQSSSSSRFPSRPSRLRASRGIPATRAGRRPSPGGRPGSRRRRPWRRRPSRTAV